MEGEKLQKEQQEEKPAKKTRAKKSAQTKKEEVKPLKKDNSYLVVHNGNEKYLSEQAVRNIIYSRSYKRGMETLDVPEGSPLVFPKYPKKCKNC